MVTNHLLTAMILQVGIKVYLYKYKSPPSKPSLLQLVLLGIWLKTSQSFKCENKIWAEKYTPEV